MDLTITISQRDGSREHSIDIIANGLRAPVGSDDLVDRRTFTHEEVPRQFSAPVAPRFEKLDTKFWPLPSDAPSWYYVRDNVSGLIWTAGNVLPKGATWAKAEAAVRALGDGWRLPTRAELLTIVDDTRCRPAINTDVFIDTKNDWYWTSTAAASSAEFAWFVYFGSGLAGYLRRVSSDGFVRAVRSVVPAGQ